jgi:hypothetical protein
MRSYRFTRRSFLTAVGGALGLEVLLRNMEAMAAGATPPPRFLLTHWPVGTLRQRFLPSGNGSTYTPSPIIKPFEDAGLRNDMTVFYGFTDGHLRCPGGGGHEAGTPFTTTCATAAGTRQNGGEGDDGVAGGPSMDQVFLKNVQALQRPGQGYANVICDSRVDSNETSTQCLSYSYTSRSIASANPGGNISEYTPLLPRLGPVQLYADLFSSFMPGGNTPANQDAAIRALKMRKSVLDFAMSELNELKRLAPAGEAPKIDLHAEAIRKIEMQLATQIQQGGATMGALCGVPMKPADNLAGKKGNSAGYGAEQTQTDDAPIHEQVAKAHAAILLAAFQCDIIRVATFQFSPGTNHVSFKGMWPSDPNKSFMHHPVSHMSPFLSGAASQAPPTSGQAKDIYEFLCNVQTWYNQRMADILKSFKAAQDGFGGSLLDYTVIPYVTEVAEANHSRGPKAAFLFGGTKLGLKHGTFQNFQQQRPQLDLYLTCAQALLKTSDPKSVLSSERFMQFNPNAAPISGLWSTPT